MATAEREVSGQVESYPVEQVSVHALVPHPRNYRSHPEDQISHLCRSLEEHGFYRNVVLARDGTILAGHGIVQAARRIGLEHVSAVRLPLDPDSPAALKVLIGDNEVEHLAEQDDRLLADLLKEIGEVSPDELIGTGYDQQMLANLAFVTRPASEIAHMDEAEHWVGMPQPGEPRREIQVIVNFACDEDRDAFIAQSGVSMTRRSGVEGYTGWWPVRDREDLRSLSIEVPGDE